MSHGRARDHAARVFEVAVEASLVPGEARILHRLAEFVPGESAGAAAEHAGERRADAVLAALDAVAREIYDEWAGCQHFTLYEDVPEVLRSLHASGIKIGLISNAHRCLASFQTHFDLEGLFTVAVSSVEHGYMKPHRSIFEAALRAADVDPSEAVMVGDSLMHDVAGARRLGMRGVLVARSGRIAAPPGVPVIESLRELPALL